MKAFMDADFLLNTDTAKMLFQQTAKDAPIIDYHCHIDPREIYEDRRYDNITQVWLGGDHYKWRLMRCAGVEEKYITGDASDREKFQKWAETLAKAVGNPLYHWTHLELQRFFGYHGVLNGATAETVWNLCNEKLRDPGYSVRGLITMSNVACLCTTDDPVDTLEWHEKLAADRSFATTVLPAWRPDKAMQLEKATYLEYLARLEKVSGHGIRNFAQLLDALRTRLDFFAAHGCRLSDHGVEYVCYAPADSKTIERIFKKRLKGKLPTAEEAAQFQTAFMLAMGQEYQRRGWVMQLHYGCKRDNNPPAFARLGPDTGYDTIDNGAPVRQLSDFLGALESAGGLPKTILYSLNPCDDAAIDTLCGCFQGGGIAGKMQHGSAWWFNDHFDGMMRQLSGLASDGYLAGFVGMLTDSRSFLSYPRHEYFRRILCRLLGEWVEDGRYPNDPETLRQIVRAISYENAKVYFDFPEKQR